MINNNLLINEEISMDDCTKYYVDENKNVKRRSFIEEINMKLFAGFKILFNLFFSWFFLIVLFPLFLIIGLAIKIESKGPVFFKQTRIGKHGKPFTLYKFRTMVADNDVYDLSKKDQFTKIGKILRRTSLDELGQLLNIAILEMAFIGPRPWLPDYYESMNEIQKHRCDVRPGITGLAQCMGRNNISIFEKINYDLKYVKNYSLFQDIKIVFLTISCMFTGHGADAGKETINEELKALREQ